MRSLSALEIIDLWERGADQHPLDRALTLLEASGGESRESLAQASIGRRDSQLLLVHQQLFGDSLQAFAQCPQCGEHLEYTLSIAEMLARSAGPAESAELTLAEGEMQWQLRLPNSVDLGTVAACADMPSARRLLASRCVVGTLRGGVAVDAQELTDAAVEQIASRLAGADPQADMSIDLNCAACSHGWQVVLEPESFLWVKIGALARRLLYEVHALARAYGWSEQQVLALSPFRRQAYLEMVG